MGEPIVTGTGRRAARHPSFKALNTALGNIKTAIAAFAYRFNRRYDPSSLIPRLGWLAARTQPIPYRVLKLAEIYG